MDGCYTVVCEENAAIRSYLDGASAGPEALNAGEPVPTAANDAVELGTAPFVENGEPQTQGPTDLVTVEVSEHGTQTDFAVESVLPV
jgi:hypothetical protein